METKLLVSDRFLVNSNAFIYGLLIEAIFTGSDYVFHAHAVAKIPFQQCCESAHLNHCAVETPEQLMCLRYSAHVLGLVDYVVATYHPSCTQNRREKVLPNP